VSVVDDVKAVCDRLAPLGWRDLLMAVSNGQLDIAQPTGAALKTEVRKPLTHVDTSFPGFEDFAGPGARGVAAGSPSRSLLYHALASPRVVRDSAGQLLRGFPTIPDIEAVENLVFGIEPRTLAQIVKMSGAPQLSVVVFATEYRPAQDCPDGQNADITFSRTGIARIGTARPKYLPDVRGFWPEDNDNPQAFRVVPIRFTTWLAAPVTGNRARVMRVGSPVQGDADRIFWIPIHKLFDGRECIRGLDLSPVCSARFFNMKLQRVFQSLDPPLQKNGPPFVREDGLAQLIERSEFGRIAVVPTVQKALVEPATLDGEFLTFRVPADNGGAFATYSTPTPSFPGLDAEIHRFPAYVHARSKVSNGTIVDLNDEVNVQAEVAAGDYDALLYADFTGEGWIQVEVPALAGKTSVKNNVNAAYVLLSAPDFFPSTGQREISQWARSKQIPAKFRNRIWGVPPDPLNNTRLPANLQLPGAPFDPAEDTITAVVAMGIGGTPPSLVQMLDVVRAATLPDDAAGVFAPGWDVSVDVLGDINTGTPHLAAYGLGSPFPEDAKLCAALSTFWPTVAPDVYRGMSMHTGNPNLRGTVAPLTDVEIGQVGLLPWDGVPGPRVVTEGGKKFVESASFLHVDYVRHAVENRFSPRLLGRITPEEYKRRIIAAARVYHILSEGGDIRTTRRLWLLLSFRAVPLGDVELQQAQMEAGHILKGIVYHVSACHVGSSDPSEPLPSNPRIHRMALLRENHFYVSAEDPIGLHRGDLAVKFASAAAE
jgi:hypothetical protein